jgi:ribosomal-protein-alanine N-acetyltransferase
MAEAIRIVRMRRRHLGGVMRIENRAYTRPWSLAIFLSELSQLETRHYYVALQSRRVVGYCGLMVAVGEGHITNVAVDPELQGSGIATRLLLNAFSVAMAEGARDMTLEVRASNHRAQRLYFSFGFQPVGVRKDYYQDIDSKEDAIIMWAYAIASEEERGRRDEIAHRISQAPRPKGHSDVEDSSGGTHP